MYALSLSEAKKFVRAKLDEQQDNYSDLMEDIDTSDLDSLIAKLLPETINEVHLMAPANMLDGKMITPNDYVSGDFDIDTDGVFTFSINKPFLRLVAFKAKDSYITVNEVVPEVSPEGRMQLNPFTRGTSRNPRLVLMQGKKASQRSTFKYFSLAKSYTDKIQAIDRFEYIELYRYAGSTTSYDIAEYFVNDVIDRLAGKILAIYGDSKANAFLGNGETDSQQ